MDQDIFGKLFEDARIYPKKKEEESPGEIAAGCFASLLLMPISVFYGGFVFMMLWNWFMPLIGVTTISFALAIALRVCISSAKGYSIGPADLKASRDRIDKEGTLHVILEGAISLTFFHTTGLFLGYILQAFFV